MKGAYIEKKKLLEIIKKNRDSHADVVKRAIVGYRKHAAEKFQELLKKVNNGEDFDNFISFTEPQDHTADYDRVIKMLEMSTAESIELEDWEFRNYVQDEWEWSKQAFMANSTYLAK